MKKNRVISALGIAAISVGVVAGLFCLMLTVGIACMYDFGPSLQDRLAAGNTEQLARKVIPQHFRDKYGAEVEIKTLAAKMIGSGMEKRIFNGVVEATVLCEGETVEVRVYSDGEVRDNRQAQEITAGVRAYVLQTLGLPAPLEERWGGLGESLLVQEYYHGEQDAPALYARRIDSIELVYEQEVAMDDAFKAKVNALLDAADSQVFFRLVVLQPGALAELGGIEFGSGYGTPEPYTNVCAPYVRQVLYREKDWEKPPVLTERVYEFQYLPHAALCDIRLTGHNGNQTFTFTPAPPPEGWGLANNQRQIGEAYQVTPAGSYNGQYPMLFVPTALLAKWCQTYDRVYIFTADNTGVHRRLLWNANGEPGELQVEGAYCVVYLSDSEYCMFVGETGPRA